MYGIVHKNLIKHRFVAKKNYYGNFLNNFSKKAKPFIYDNF